MWETRLPLSIVPNCRSQILVVAGCCGFVPEESQIRRELLFADQFPCFPSIGSRRSELYNAHNLRSDVFTLGRASEFNDTPYPASIAQAISRFGRRLDRQREDSKTDANLADRDSMNKQEA